MKHEPFIYLWYIAWTKKFYLGVTNGKKEYYTHSAITSDEFRSIVPYSKRPLSERKEFMNNLPKGVRYRKLSKRLIDHFMKEFDIEGDTIYEKMCKLEHKLLVNRKSRHWDRYYNVSLGDPKYVDVSGENNPMFGKKRTEEYKQKYSYGENNPMFGKTHAELGTKFPDRYGKGNSFYGKTHSEEHKQKYSYGKNNPMYGRTGEKHPNFGRPVSEKTKTKIRETIAKNKVKTLGLGTLEQFMG